MQFITLATVIVSAVAVLAVPTPGADGSTSGTASARLNQLFDNAASNLNGVACSTGDNGLVTAGFNTFGDLPSFPFIGGVPGVVFNSPLCGTCWNLTSVFFGETVFILAVDAAGDGTFNVGQTALDDLTEGNAVALGADEVIFELVDPSYCNFP